MCLELSHKEKKIAESDIYCLKLVEYYNPKDGTCRSYFLDRPQIVGKMMKSKLEVLEDTVEEGLHAIKMAVIPAGKFSVLPFCSTTIMLAVIPKGSIYYLGRDGDIVSNRMMLVEPLVSNDNANDLPHYCEHKLSVSDLINVANRILYDEGYEGSKNLFKRGEEYRIKNRQLWG